jgi:hypothetical protein
MKFKFRYIIIFLVLVSFGSCVAREPKEPQTVIQVQTEPGQPTGDTEGEPESEAPVEGDEEMLRAYQQYSSDYLAALASTSDLAEAEWNQGIRCRAASVAQAAQLDAEKNNTGLEAELIKRLRAVNTSAKAKAEGKRFFSHDANGFADFRDPGADVIVLVMLLQEMQEGNPSFPMCSQTAGALWRQVDKILASADEMARTDPQSVPVRIPVENAQEAHNVAN